MKPAARIFVAVLFALGAAQALGQEGAIPPPATEAGLSERDRAAQQELVRSGAVSTPGVIIQGSGILNKVMGETGSNIYLGTGGSVGKAMSQGNAVVKIVEETAKDGADGLMRQGIQTVLDQGGEKAGEAAAGFAARRAVAAGVSSTLASGGSAIAFTAGTVIGGYVRDSPTVGGWVGLPRGRTIGDVVDDAYFKAAPDMLKEWASGVPQVDINSPEFEREQQQKIAARKRQAMFNQVQSDNAEQQRQIDAAAAASAAAANSAAAAAPPQPDNTASILNLVRDSMVQYQQGRGLQSQPAAGPVCTIDPNTGCHPGHDEKSHPGGCKCAR